MTIHSTKERKGTKVKVRRANRTLFMADVHGAGSVLCFLCANTGALTQASAAPGACLACRGPQLLHRTLTVSDAQAR